MNMNKVYPSPGLIVDPDRLYTDVNLPPPINLDIWNIGIGMA